MGSAGVQFHTTLGSSEVLPSGCGGGGGTPGPEGCKVQQWECPGQTLGTHVVSVHRARCDTLWRPSASVPEDREVAQAPGHGTAQMATMRGQMAPCTAPWREGADTAEPSSAGRPGDQAAENMSWVGMRYVHSAQEQAMVRDTTGSLGDRASQEMDARRFPGSQVPGGAGAGPRNLVPCLA